ncbi:MAG: hypothetical protein H0V62_15410 [Gammaproteobacteria bacterium]|nr:hypothetical protein [Gammaproteobacteria bacterium]
MARFFVIGVNTGVALHQRLEFEREGAIAGLDHKAAFIGRRGCVLFQCVSFFFFPDLKLALENSDFLIQLVERFLSRGRRVRGTVH